jgi:thiamine pyrophosphate-dependent acetolactate synthase large subunit-like protein
MISRIQAIAAAVGALPDAAFVVTCGATSREMAAVADRPNNLYLLDSMGLTTSVALGVAVGLRDRFPHVVAIDGDGSLLMNLGSLATIGAYAPSNLTVLLLDNAEHASASSVPTSSPKFDLCRVAEGCGMQASEIVTDPEVVAGLRAAALDGRPHFLRVRIAGGNTSGIPWLHADPVVLAERFRTWAQPEPEVPADA